MTVRELMAELKKVKNKSAKVVLAKDAEGNQYSPAAFCRRRQVQGGRLRLVLRDRPPR